MPERAPENNKPESKEVLTMFFPDSYLEKLAQWSKEYSDTEISLERLKILRDNDKEVKRIQEEGTDEEFEQIRDNPDYSFRIVYADIELNVPAELIRKANIAKLVEYGYTREAAEKIVSEDETDHESSVRGSLQRIDDKMNTARTADEIEKSFEDLDEPEGPEKR